MDGQGEESQLPSVLSLGSDLLWWYNTTSPQKDKALDPNVAYHELGEILALDFLNPTAADRGLELVMGILQWIDGGGFLPTNVEHLRPGAFARILRSLLHYFDNL